MPALQMVEDRLGQSAIFISWMVAVEVLLMPALCAARLLVMPERRLPSR